MSLKLEVFIAFIKSCVLGQFKVIYISCLFLSLVESGSVTKSFKYYIIKSILNTSDLIL